MADVVLKQTRQSAEVAFAGSAFAHVPIRHEFLAVRIRQHAKNDVVVQQPHGFRVGAAHHLIHLFHLLLRTHRFGGVQPAVDPHHGFAFMRERARLIVRQTFGACQPSGNIFIVIEPLDIFGRADHRHILAAIFRGWAYIDQLHAIGFGCQFVPIGVELRVVRHLVVVAEIEPERFFRGRYFRRVLGTGFQLESAQQPRARTE